MNTKLESFTILKRNLITVNIMHTLMDVYRYTHDQNTIRRVARDGGMCPLSRADKNLLRKEGDRGQEFIDLMS